MDDLLKCTREHYEKYGRHTLPWRKTRNPYRILVSEMMLQQTQVDRVIPFYKAFLKVFPTPRALAKASLSEVVHLWQGLGYNRRAKYLHEAAKMVVHDLGGRMPREVSELECMPGVGPYTARAIAAFAYDQPTVFIETNIRTVFMYHHPSGQAKISDDELLPLVERALNGSSMSPGEFYAALMDYGTHLKKSGVRLNTKSSHYTRQTAFAGSLRQVRGAVLGMLAEGAKTERHLLLSTQKTIRADAPKTHQALAGLLRDGLIRKQRGRWMIAQ